VRSGARRLLSLLHLLHLRGLLLMLLLQLLRFHRISFLFRQLLMFVFLLLLELLPILVLLGDDLGLLLLVFLIELRVSCIRSGGSFDGRQFLGVRCGGAASSGSNRWWLAANRCCGSLRAAHAC
jgi:hypothetical protein